MPSKGCNHYHLDHFHTRFHSICCLPQTLRNPSKKINALILVFNIFITLFEKKWRIQELLKKKNNLCEFYFTPCVGFLFAYFTAHFLIYCSEDENSSKKIQRFYFTFGFELLTCLHGRISNHLFYKRVINFEWVLVLHFIILVMMPYYFLCNFMRYLK